MQPPSPSLELPVPARPLSGRTLLLVEDESFIADMLVSWFERLGARTLWANQGAEAIRMMQENHDQICLVIADFRLPDMDGSKMCVQLRELKASVPVLLSSGRYQREAEELLARTGPTQFIQKPYPLNEVLAKVHLLLQPTPVG